MIHDIFTAIGLGVFFVLIMVLDKLGAIWKWRVDRFFEKKIQKMREKK